jgi:hypothetical protein
LLKKNFN